MLEQPQEPSPRDFLKAVESGQDVKDMLLEWQRKKTDALDLETKKQKVEELKRSLFADEAQADEVQERQSSGSLQATEVIRAIETEKHAAKRRRLRPVRLEPTCEGYTVLTPIIQFRQGDYHAVIERGRAFSLKIIDTEATTESLVDIASRRCFELRGQWPTCVLIKTERLFVLDEEIYERGHITVEGAQVPFDCAEPHADYDVKAVISKEGDDEWVNDRKAC